MLSIVTIHIQMTGYHNIRISYYLFIYYTSRSDRRVKIGCVEVASVINL